MIRKLLVVTGGLISANGFFVSTFANFNLGVILCDLLGIFLLLWGLFYDKIQAKTSSGFLKVLKRIICILLICETAFAAFLFLYGNIDNVTYKEDALIVLGAAVQGERVSNTLKLRLDKAVAYHKKNPRAIIVVSGGKGAQEDVTEAYAMEKYLVSAGVDKTKIIREDKAASTSENMRFSKEILDSLFKEMYETVVVTNGFHVFRSVNIAKREGINPVRHIHSGLEFYNIFPCYLRESLAVFKLWIAG